MFLGGSQPVASGEQARRWTSPAGWRVRAVAWLLLMGLCGIGLPLLPATAGPPYFAQEGEPEEEGIALLQSEPHDLIRIKPAAGGGWAKVVPIDFPGRELPANPSGPLRVEILGFPTKDFEVDWSDIASIDLWEKRLQREARQRIKDNDFSGAFPFLSILMRDFPNVPGLRELRSEFLLRDAGQHFRNGELKETLAILEELRRYAPQYQADVVLRVIGDVTDRLMEKMLERDQLDYAQQLLSRLKQDYSSDEVASIPKWSKRFREMATVKQEAAIAAVEAEDYRRARQLARASLNIDPSLAGTRALVRRIDQAYPLVRVGVLQRATELDPTRIDNWPARRAGNLVYRALFEPRGAGPEGGEYEFLFGETQLSDDRLVFSMDFAPTRLEGPLGEIDTYTLADVLAARAQRASPTYHPAWASALEELSVLGPQSLDCLLRRPHVLPQALLQIKVDGSWIGQPPETPTGLYHRDTREEDATRFVLNRLDPDEPEQLREIVEVDAPDAAGAVASMLRGELDAIDHLFPADAARLEKAENIRVQHYPLPSVHMLVPCSDHAFLADRTFRRALAYAINRQDVLQGELLQGQRVQGCQVVSGPFPAGVERNDPLAYAYDASILPRPYQPRLAKLLITMTRRQRETLAKKRDEPPPELKPIRLAVPADNIAAIAAEAIKVQLELLEEFPVEIVDLPPGQSMPEAGTADLVYVSAAVWEPIIDARRILGPEGLAGSQDQLVGLGLRRLESARNWREIGQRLKDLHRISHHELPVIPLWQLVDYYAYRTNLTGVGSDIVSLYQNVDNWRLGL